MQIKEVSEITDLAPSTLRYYEDIGLIPNVKRGAGNNRDYSEENVEWIDFILCMRRAGLPIEALKEYTDLVLEGESTAGQRKKLLEDEKEKLLTKQADLEETLSRINVKISHYEKV